MKGPQFQKSKMVNHVRTCGADVGDAPRCILTGQRVIFKQMPQMAPETPGRDAVLEDCSG